MGAGASAGGAEPCQQGFEALAIVVAHSNESQAEAAAALYMTNDSVGFDAPFLNQEIELGRHAFFHIEVRSLDKEAVDTYVQDAGHIVAFVAAPAEPDILRGWKPGQGTARVGLFLKHEGPLERHAVGKERPGRPTQLRRLHAPDFLDCELRVIPDFITNPAHPG
jgi:hypothetical protein